jgi:hypothetical protein
MENANLSQEISRMYKDLSDHILAKDGEGASRIYQELLRAGQSLDILATRVPAIRIMPKLELFGQQPYEEQGSSRIPDVPPQGRVQPGFARGSTIERAAQRLDWTTAFGVRHNTVRGLEGTRNQQSQLDPVRAARALRLRFGHFGPTRRSLIFRVFLASVLTAAAGTGIFLLTHSAEKKATVESARATEAPAKGPQKTSSIGSLAMSPPAAGTPQGATLAGAVPTAAPTLAASELAAEPALGTPPGGPLPSAARTSPNKPQLKDPATPSAPTLEAASTIAPPASRSPSTKPAFSGVEIAALMARGDWLFATGEVDSARLLYERAVDAGEARAAVRLGETFDPIFLHQAHLRQGLADSGMAVFWYRRARDLGANGVASRLKSLEAKSAEKLP